MLELGRRVKPPEIVATDQKKSRLADAVTHVPYEAAGTAASFTTALAFVPELGEDFAYIATPPAALLAGGMWCGLYNLHQPLEELELEQIEEPPEHQGQSPRLGKRRFLASIKECFTSLTRNLTSSLLLALRTLSRRQYIWLLPCYSLALYGHRFLPGGLGTPIAQRYLGEAIWSRFITGGNNLGEMLGALAVILASNRIPTPLPWLRNQCFLYLILWWLSYWRTSKGNIGDAWLVGIVFVPISAGWAAGEVVVLAWIQSQLGGVRGARGIPVLPAVMGLLYSISIIIYAIASSLLGKYVDAVYNRTGGAKGGRDIHGAMFRIAGVQFSIFDWDHFCVDFCDEGRFLRPSIDEILGADGGFFKGSWSLHPKSIAAPAPKVDSEQGGSVDREHSVEGEEEGHATGDTHAAAEP
jgi:hypothetical protein